MKIKKNDTVLVIAGKDRGKTGKVRFVYPAENKVIVEGVNMIKKHARANAQTRQGGIIEREAKMNASNVMILCSKCNKPARVGHKLLEDGKKVRFCRVCQEVLD
ncbi:MAG: 50S ribosomal protein L24 [Dehalococcoidales bacterium]|nr:50S ribosomal protein L24 [Dehalococcoidales bacterium]